MRLFIFIFFVTTVFSSCQSKVEPDLRLPFDKSTPVNHKVIIPTISATFTPAPTLTRPVTLTPTVLPTKTISPTIKPEETAVISIPLAGPASSRNAEISGMAWFGDWLILLPQYPNFGGDSGDGRIFALSRTDVINFLNGKVSGPLTPRAIPFFAPGLNQNISGFEGYEAILFDGNNAYLTIEASPLSGMTGYLVKGTMADDLSGIQIDTENISKIKSATGLPNKSDETLLHSKDEILSLHEANGHLVNPHPAATRFSLGLKPKGFMPMASIEYRITDATEVDEHGRFWAINYFFPGEPELKPEFDPVAAVYGQGVSHAQNDGVERLIEFQIDDEKGITMINKPPIHLELLPDELRNWEGIVRLEGYGFLLVTDKFPETILGFVPA